MLLLEFDTNGPQIISKLGTEVNSSEGTMKYVSRLLRNVSHPNLNADQNDKNVGVNVANNPSNGRGNDVYPNTCADIGQRFF